MPTKFLAQKNLKPTEAPAKNVFEHLQGGVLKGHGRDHTVQLFFRFTGNAAQAKALMKALTAKVTSMTQQLADSAAFKAGETSRPFCSLFLTAKGYKALGFSAAKLAAAFPEPPSQIQLPNQVKFADGMASHGPELGDPAPATWEPGYADAAGKAVLDGMVLLANDSLPALEFAAWDAARIVTAGGAEVLATQAGLALFNKDKSQNLEHFGYVDGRSQPTYLQADRDREEHQFGGVSPWDPAEPVGRVLVPDALAPAADAGHSFGSFLVYRKLEQNVKGFKSKEQEVADALGLTGDAREVAGAYAVGRFEDGTPVVVRDRDGLNLPVPNNFVFSGPAGADPSGGKCPFHAHVRKVSPRGDSANGNPDDALERSHRITRRGITYGTRTVEPKDDPTIDQMPTGGVGLLFMCFQASIDNQFAFMQRAWANSVGFVKPATGLDPVIAQPAGTVPVPQKWPNPYGTPAGATVGFESFVTLRGGEFFFCPSLPFLKSL